MHKFRCTLACTLALVLAAGSGAITAADGPLSAVPRFAAQITFGDDSSDVGTHAVSSIAAGGGGKYTINGDGTTLHPELNGKTWTEMMAPVFGLPAPCPAQTGMQGDPALGLSVPVVNYPWCYGYAQGGARVLDPAGPGSAAAGSPLGQLAVPVASQVANHLAVAGGRFQGNEIVFVSAGFNDVLVQWERLAVGANQAALGAPGNPSQAISDYLLVNAGFAITLAGNAGNDLASLVRQQIVGNGANYVVVNNLPDMAGTPGGMAQPPQVRALVQTMVDTFNRALVAGLAAEPKVLLVDVNFLTRDETFNPAFYALSNTTAPACAPNAFGENSLTCNVFNTQPGVDVSHYLFADSLHPTPYAQWLIARQVVWAMQYKGWL